MVVVFERVGIETATFATKLFDRSYHLKYGKTVAIVSLLGVIVFFSYIDHL